jgi:hypothetical protein
MVTGTAGSQGINPTVDSDLQERLVVGIRQAMDARSCRASSCALMTELVEAIELAARREALRLAAVAVAGRLNADHSLHL